MDSFFATIIFFFQDPMSLARVRRVGKIGMNWKRRLREVYSLWKQFVILFNVLKNKELLFVYTNRWLLRGLVVRRK